MTKRRPFDPTVLEQNRPSQSVKPIDFMKPMEETAFEPETAPPPTRDDRRSTRVAPVVLPDDPRTQPAPPDDGYNVTSVKLKLHRQEQLRHEKLLAKRDIQDVIETALDEYFRKRYGRGSTHSHNR